MASFSFTGLGDACLSSYQGSMVVHDNLSYHSLGGFFLIDEIPKLEIPDTIEIFESNKSLGIRFSPHLEVTYGFFGLYSVTKKTSSDLLEYLVKFLRRFGTRTERPIDSYSLRDGFSFFEFEYYKVTSLIRESLILIFDINEARKIGYMRSNYPMESLNCDRVLKYKRLKSAYNFLLISYFSKMLSDK